MPLYVFVRGFHRKSSPLKALSLFRKAFGKYLLLTNTLTSGALMAIGDLIHQEIEYTRQILPKRYDWYRLTRMLLVGFSLGPLSHCFYKYLDFYLPKRNLSSVSKKILVDQLLMSPVCIVVFFYGTGLLEGKTIEECTHENNSKFVEVYMLDWLVCPPTQFINFYFIPLRYQVVYINIVTTIFNVFLSYIKHRELGEGISNTHTK